jgi:membrane fusion protein (multidrug efflux system)
MVFPNPKEILLPGMFVRAVVEEGVRNQAILVPQQAVSRDVKGQPFAWVVGPDNKVQRRALEIERAIGNRWLVTSGLSASDRVIMEGTDRVKAGVPVRAVPFKGDLGPAVGGGQTEKAGGHV